MIKIILNKKASERKVMRKVVVPIVIPLSLHI